MRSTTLRPLVKVWVFHTALLASAIAVARPAPLENTQLSMLQAVQEGVARNLPLVSERLLLERQKRAERGAWYGYSPTVFLNSDVVRSRAGVDPFGRTALLSYSSGVFWRSPLGTEVSAEGVMSQGLPVDTGDHQGALVLTVSQPLLKDAWTAGAGLPLTQAVLQKQIQKELFRSALNQLIVDVQTAYWDLGVAEADVAIKTRSRQRAKQQYEDTAENIRRGILAPVEIYVVEDNVVFFEQELLRAEEGQRRARTRLAELLAVPPDSPLSPAEELARPVFGVPERDEVLKVALGENPRIVAQQLQRSLAQERERYVFNQTLPEVDLNASLSMFGSDPRYSTTWRETLTDPKPEARVGVSLSLPLDRGAATAQADTARLDSEREAVALANAEQQVRFEVVNGLTDLGTNLRLHALAEKQVQLAELKLAAENEKYKSGISTLADVVRFQRELDDALIRLQRVTRSVHVGRIRLLAAQGTLHREVGVEVD